MRIIRLFIFVTLCLQLVDCATIVHGSKQKVNFTSTPSGAELLVNGQSKGNTPVTLKLKRNINYKVQYQLPGYLSYNTEIERKIDPLIFGNLFMGGFIGLGIDAASGSMFRLDKKDLFASLSKDENTGLVNKSVVVNSIKAAGKSDVDINIPQNGSIREDRFSLIIGNEDYSTHQLDLSSEVNVDYARNDAIAFKEYAINILGIPEKNIVFLLDATTGQMNQAISKINLIIKNTMGKADVFIYYAGHGLPDEQTREPYLIPVDVSGKNPSGGIKLSDFYTKLTQYPSARVTVFIDACFSGGARNLGLVATRGVKVKPKEEVLNNNIVVFTACSGEQTSLPYKDKQHGIFTYFLLKKLQDTKGKVTYSELSQYVKENVSLQSILINDKEQTPQVKVSTVIENEWTKYDIIDK